jgi:hypothetical protein
MIGSKTAVFGVYSTAEDVERAGDTLVTSGFSDSDIAVLLPEELDTGMNRASFVLSVSCATTDQIERAKEILERTMTQDLSKAGSLEPGQSAQVVRADTLAGRVN